MNILIVSDLHAMSMDIESLEGGYNGSSGALLRVEHRNELANPLLSIRQALERAPCSIDLMLCLGDLTHQGKRPPLMIAWQDIHHIAQALNVSSVIGIIGNHDIMSRANNAQDIEARVEFLAQIRPSFPSSDQPFNKDYFAEGVASTAFGDCLFIALNTCRTHGLGLDKGVTQDVFEKGVLTDAMIERVVGLARESELDHLVLAMHHHPVQGPHGPTGEEPIPKGNILIAELEQLNKNILLVHGHQHRVGLHKPSMAAKSPYIFSCASLCAYPYPGQHTDFSNQFHLVKFDTTVSAQPTGTILSWDWSANRWQKSARPHMPHERHFGPSVDITDTATLLKALPKKPFYSAKDLITAVPALKFLSMPEVALLNNSLENDGLRVVVDAGRLSGLVFEEEQA